MCANYSWGGLQVGLDSVLKMLSGLVAFLGILFLGWSVRAGGIGLIAFSGVAYKLTKPQDPYLEG
jgi:hypothetical protein